jgi:phage shock protein C
MDEHLFDSPHGRLYRSRSDRMVAGVCAGLAQYLNVDPVIVRLGFVALALTTGLGFLAYIALAVVAPNRPVDEPEPPITGSPLDSRRSREVAGYGLAGIGVLALAGNLGLYHLINFDILWPAALVAVGVMLLIKRSAD